MATQKTFDQIRVSNPEVDAVESPELFVPHEAINARVVFEPMPEQGHVRVTARSETYELLWGVTASPGMIAGHPVEVAFYDRLRELARAHLPVQSEPTGTEAIAHVLQRVTQVRNCLETIQSSLTPKKVSDKTEKRASSIVLDMNDVLRILNDAVRRLKPRATTEEA